MYSKPIPDNLHTPTSEISLRHSAIAVRESNLFLRRNLGMNKMGSDNGITCCQSQNTTEFSKNKSKELTNIAVENNEIKSSNKLVTSYDNNPKSLRNQYILTIPVTSLFYDCVQFDQYVLLRSTYLSILSANPPNQHYYQIRLLNTIRNYTSN